MSRSIFTITLMLLLFGGVSAGIIKVPDNYATIQAGIDAAVKGDTVLVAAGTYYENINFKGKAITVASYFYAEGDTDYINSTIIDGSRPSDPNKGSVVSFASGEDTASVICGFTITGGTGTMYDATYRVGGGIYCSNSGARICNNKIVHNIINHTKDCDGGGICYWPRTQSMVRYVIIENNIIESNALISSYGQAYLNGGGIHLVKGRITGNTIRYNSVGGQPRFSGGGGIAAGCEDTEPRTLVVISGNTITHNQVYAPGYGNYGGGWGGGVDAVFGNVQIINNVISYNKAGGNNGVGAGIRLWRSKEISLIKDNIISYNSITALTEYGWAGGIELWQTEGVQVINNIIEGNNARSAAGGIDESGCSRNLISGNFIKSNTGGEEGGGIWAMNGKIINNVIVENEARRGGGIFYYYHPSFGSKVAQIINNTLTKNVADTAGAIAIYRANAVVMNTISWGNSALHGPEIELWGGTLNAAYSDIQFGASGIVIDSTATVNWLTGNINTNPLFEYSSYQLSNASPCIGAGTEGIMIGGTGYYSPGDDFAGNLRPNPPESTTPDIGAYENPLDKPIGPILVPEQYATIQAGINAAKAGEIVLVKDGTYYENINFKGKAITVASYYLMDGDTTHINNTIIDGSKPSHADSGSVVYFVSGEDTTSILCGFTITKGSGTEATFVVEGTLESSRGGGGIFCYNSGARIINNKIIENTVHSPDKGVVGGGLAAWPFGSAAHVILQDNQISHNTLTADLQYALGGGVELECNGILLNNLISYNSIVHNATDNQACSGGVDCYSLPTDRRKVIVESNKITHNSIISKSNIVGISVVGGGICIYGSYGRFAKNEVSYNELWANADKNAGGAGILINEAPNSLIIKGNIIHNNAVKQGNGLGGGVLIGKNSSPMVINNIIEGNSANVGGGFIIARSTAQLINNTVINNQATSGGGINVRMSSTVYLMNNIVWGNQASTYAGIQLEDATIKAAYCDIQGGWSGTGNLNADPLFADTLFHLSDKSPCIGKGIASFDFGGGMMCCCPATDKAGNLRPDPAGSKPDIGAYESPLPPTEVMDLAETKIPQSYFLAQNYPNPFNPSTTIEFALPKSAFVTLKVYNLLGEEVATLIAEQRSAGIHQLNWDARGLASGVYLYRLEVGDPSTGSGQGLVQVKKLILMR